MDSIQLSLLGRDSQELEFTAPAQTFLLGMSIVAVFCPIHGRLDNISLHNMCCMSVRSASRAFTCSGSTRPPCAMLHVLSQLTMALIRILCDPCTVDVQVEPPRRGVCLSLCPVY